MDDTVEEFIARYEPPIQDLVQGLRALVKDAMPDAEERAMPGRNAIGYGGPRVMADMVCYIAGFKSHANLGFIEGTSLPDPDRLLEGSGENLRHVKVRTAADVQRAGLRALVEAAAARAE